MIRVDRIPARLAAVALGLSPAAFLVASPGCDDGVCATGGSTRTLTMVTNTIRFAVHEDPEGQPDVIVGMDLDRYVSTRHDDPGGCGRADQVDPQGNPGIDNAIAPLFEAIIELTGDAVYGLIETSIEDGSLLIMVKVDGIDDLRNDPCVNVTILKGTGEPELGTDGAIAPDQTFGVDESTPISHGSGSIVDGVLLAGPFEAVIPLSFFAVRADMRFHGAYLRGAITEDGGLGDPYDDDPYNDYAMITGGVEAEQIYDLADQAGAMDHNAEMLAKFARLIVPTLADLAPREFACDQLSGALLIRTTPAHLLGDPL